MIALRATNVRQAEGSASQAQLAKIPSHLARYPVARKKACLLARHHTPPKPWPPFARAPNSPRAGVKLKVAETARLFRPSAYGARPIKNRVDQSYEAEDRPDPDRGPAAEGRDEEGGLGRHRGNGAAEPAAASVAVAAAAAASASAGAGMDGAAATEVAAAAVPPGVFRAVWDDNNK